jgi:hypothetical protein
MICISPPAKVGGRQRKADRQKKFDPENSARTGLTHTLIPLKSAMACEANMCRQMKEMKGIIDGGPKRQRTIGAFPCSVPAQALPLRRHPGVV